MKFIAAVILGITALFAVPTPANATYEQVCVQGEDGKYFPFVIESQEDRDWIGDRDVKPFPNTVLGCNSYNPPNSVPEPVTSTASTTDTAALDAANAEVSRLRTVVTSLRATVARLRAANARLRAAR